MPKANGSWRSTAVAIAGGFAALLIQGVHLYKGLPIDEASITNAVTIIVLGFVVRDDKVTSESAGAK